MLLALFAVLMLFIAPEISKSLAHTVPVSGERHGHDSGSDNSASHGLSDTAESASGLSAAPAPHHAERHIPPHDMMPMANPGTMDDSACGYCQLLIHLPFLTWLFTPFIWLTLVISRPPPDSSFAYIPFAVLTADRQPRAPPHKPALR